MTRAETFLDCAQAYAGLVRLVRDEDWDRPALGVWDVRALVGHTTRALTTVVEYLDQPAPDAADVLSAADYFHRFLTSPDRAGANEAVAARGVAAGAELGSDPAAYVGALVVDVRTALGQVPSGRLVTTRFGPLRLEEYLRTRTFELVVHGLDLLRAIGASADLLPPAALAEALELAAQTAARSGHAAVVLSALTGRTELPAGFAVV
ncbi:maleylpyruvate isomerase N-terminal domain-containing protein [Georgenia sp. H159]|uniref:maleylpyruvate isomerase N-terminal domain-containing protein n=1 Tax=Georgenia sp. H159 TaxID=3076115 RepID=UPI002D788C63|nr:maleylpyruvate isomerase N-terminal domain-containing protein [Georgenia sp. H159]